MKTEPFPYTPLTEHGCGLGTPTAEDYTLGLGGESVVLRLHNCVPPPTKQSKAGRSQLCTLTQAQNVQLDQTTATRHLRVEEPSAREEAGWPSFLSSRCARSCL